MGKRILKKIRNLEAKLKKKEEKYNKEIKEIGQEIRETQLKYRPYCNHIDKDERYPFLLICKDCGLFMGYRNEGGIK